MGQPFSFVQLLRRRCCLCRSALNESTQLAKASFLSTLGSIDSNRLFYAGTIDDKVLEKVRRDQISGRRGEDRYRISRPVD